MSSIARGYIIAGITAVAAGFSFVPYGWAHITAGALTTTVTVFAAGTAYLLQKGK